ncbi:MAG: hypothetical protein RBU37_11185 [Myxococcota bacterium]|nr:hypothetical protein [Myxococcota bacterium]
MRPSTQRVILPGLLVLALLGCQEQGPAPLLEDHSRAALVALAQSYHVQADMALEAEHPELAEAAMRELIDALHDAGRSNQTAWELELDASTRLSRLLLERGDAAAALAEMERVLADGNSLGDNIFVGYAHQVRGDCLRALGRAAEAIEAHKQAILIFKRLLEQP